MIKYIALYLPQYHPIQENNDWYGNGFTEWVNVAKAKPLFRNHYQPHIPKDLGFYDLRLTETRREQAKMAQEYNVSAFCYWTYWFGNGKQLLEKPLWDVFNDKEICLPFCMAWANHSWEKKLWDKKSKNELLVEQQYLGASDYEMFFYKYLPLFKDQRYLRVHNKLFFLVFDPLADGVSLFIETWKLLAKKEGIDGFFFVGKDSDCRNKETILNVGFDAVYDDNVFNIHHKLSLPKKAALYFKRKFLGMPTVFQYKDAIKYMLSENSSDSRVIPVIAPNWDHSPRSGRNAILLDKCDPKYFESLVESVSAIVSKKDTEDQLVIIKSWNEWGEGNHMEPDLKYGRGYLEALKRVSDFYKDK